MTTESPLEPAQISCSKPMSLLVTTALRVEPGILERALEIAKEINGIFVNREKKNLDVLLTEHGASGIIVVEKNRISFRRGEIELFFHPGMAKLRIKEILNGKTDQMIKAMDLKPGDSILDCTMGLGADAIVASFATGPKGLVTGLEKSPVIALLVKHGLRAYRDPGESHLEQAIRRIKLIFIDHLYFLQNTTADSYDIVYFDPMFRQPLRGSASMDAMRPFTDKSKLSRETLHEAVRVCRRRVVVKEKRGSPEFERLGFTKVEGGKHAPVAYGIIEKEGGCYGERN